MVALTVRIPDRHLCHLTVRPRELATTHERTAFRYHVRSDTSINGKPLANTRAREQRGGPASGLLLTASGFPSAITMSNLQRTILAVLFVHTNGAPATTNQGYNKICVNNNAGFVLDFYMEDERGVQSIRSDPFPIAQQRCFVIAQIPNVEANTEVKVHINARLGSSSACDQTVVYDPTSQYTANFAVSGTTLNIHCSLS